MRRKIFKVILGNRCMKLLLLALTLSVTISIFLSHYRIRGASRSLTDSASAVKRTVSASAVKRTVSANANVKKNLSVMYLKKMLDEEIVFRKEDFLINRQNLSITFLEKLLDLSVHERVIDSCNSTPEKYCHDLTCPVTFSSSPTERLQQVLATRNGSLGPYLAAMDRSAASVRPHRIVFASAASSNYYGQLQALVHNVRCHVFPRLDNFIFVIYDLGLTPEQRIMTEKNCNCTVLDFPFSSLPNFFRQLTCYTWKPLIVNALLKKSDITMWMDTSVRWNPGAPLDDVFQLVKKRGVLLAISDNDGAIALRTRPSTFKFFGDRACQYHPFPEMWATFILLHNEPFIRHALVEPWVACAFSWECMCISNHWDWLACHHTLPRKEGACHRFDQSSLGIILTKLYLDRSLNLNFPGGTVEIYRGDTKDWFWSNSLECH